MKESYREGIANHPGPEPCEGSRKAALEALDRGICRLGIELRKSRFREADGVRLSGRPQLKGWEGVFVGLVLEPEKIDSGKPTASGCQEGHNGSPENARGAGPLG